jgi:hypothetical protein
MTSTLQYLGATSPTIQRVLIHLVQPLFVSSVVYLWVVLLHRPVLFAPLGAVILLYAARCYFSNKSNHELQSQESEIHPIDSSAAIKSEISAAPRSGDTTVTAQHPAVELLGDCCEEKLDSDDCEEKSSDPEHMSIDEPSLSGYDGSSIVSGGYPSSINYQVGDDDEDPSLSSSYQVGEDPSSLSSGWKPPPCHRIYSDRSLAASVLSSVDSHMEFSDPDSFSDSDGFPDEPSA